MLFCLMNSFMWKMGGAEIFCSKILQALARKSNYELFVVCEKMSKKLSSELADLNVNVIETGFTWKGSGRTIKAGVGWTLLPFHLRKITKALAKIKPDILNPHNFPDVFYATCYKKHIRNVRITWFCHEPYRPFYDTNVLNFKSPHESFFYSLYRTVFSSLDIRSVRSYVDKTLANSRYTADLVWKIYGKNAEVLYPGVDTDLFSRSCPNQKRFSEPLILSVSPIDFSYKNSQIIPLVLSRLKRNYDVQWVHIGRGRDQSRLLTLARTLKVQDSLTVINSVTEKDLVEYYSAANMVVYPPTREPFGLVPLEAMACETPIIASKYGGTAETIVNEKTGLLVDMKSISEITSAISRILVDESLGRRMGKLGRERASKYFTWEQTTKNFLGLL